MVKIASRSTPGSGEPRSPSATPTFNTPSPTSKTPQTPLLVIRSPPPSPFPSPVLNNSSLSKTQQLIRTFSISSTQPVGQTRRILSGTTPTNQRSGFTPDLTEPRTAPLFLRRQRSLSPLQLITKPTISTTARRPPLLYFTFQERQEIYEKVHTKPTVCDHHINCINCLDIEFAFHELQALPQDMDPELRQKIISNNRSLRNIKNVCPQRDLGHYHSTVLIRCRSSRISLNMAQSPTRCTRQS